MFILLSIILWSISEARYHIPRDEHHKNSVPLWIELNKSFFNETKEGDMIFGENLNNSSVGIRYLPKGSTLFWPNSRIPYLMSSYFTFNEVVLLHKAIDWFNRNTCIRWVPKEKTDFDFVNIAKQGGCRAFVGRNKGPQLLSLEKGCFGDGLPVVIHEMMHSIGFIHEHQRPDRDLYVKIHFENIAYGTLDQFDINGVRSYFQNYSLPYDIHSVMHYPENSFSNGKGNTITSRNGQRLGCRHQSQCPTKLDAHKINVVYRCSGGQRTY